MATLPATIHGYNKYECRIVTTNIVVTKDTIRHIMGKNSLTDAAVKIDAGDKLWLCTIPRHCIIDTLNVTCKDVQNATCDVGTSADDDAIINDLDTSDGTRKVDVSYDTGNGDKDVLIELAAAVTNAQLNDFLLRFNFKLIQYGNKGEACFNNEQYYQTNFKNV